MPNRGVEFDFEAASEAFYAMLFSLFPEIKSRFRRVHAQKQMFEIALKTVFKNLENDAELDRYLVHLGDRHKMMGIQPMHMTRGYIAFRAAIKAGKPDVSDADIQTYSNIYKKLLVTMGYDAVGLRF